MTPRLWPNLRAPMVPSCTMLAAPVRAAELGGDCCADLEERIAELEATTAHKGNRKVSLIGLTQVVSGHTFFLHDGRARNVEEAIVWHGGEAQAARDAYMSLTKAERTALVAFVNSL